MCIRDSSNDAVDVSAIAQIFGGGGHIKAAGCTVHGQPRDIVIDVYKRQVYTSRYLKERRNGKNKLEAVSIAHKSNMLSIITLSLIHI